jgi:hypothetical protein
VSQQDIIGWLVSSLIGFIAGYATGRAARRVAEVETAAVESKWAARRAGIFRTVFGIFLVLLAVATFLQSYAVDQCTAASLSATQRQAYDETEAQIELIKAARVDLPASDRFRIRDEYLAAAEKLQETRRTNPLRCGGPFPFVGK